MIWVVKQIYILYFLQGSGPRWICTAQSSLETERQAICPSVRHHRKERFGKEDNIDVIMFRLLIEEITMDYVGVARQSM